VSPGRCEQGSEPAPLHHRANSANIESRAQVGCDASAGATNNELCRAMASPAVMAITKSSIPELTEFVSPCRRLEIRTRRNGRRLPEVLPRGPRAPCAQPAERCCRRRNDLLGERLHTSSSSDMRACAASQPLRCIATLNPAKSLSASARAARINGAHASQASMYSSGRLSSAISAASDVDIVMQTSSPACEAARPR
jgi:hypothetical protein